MRCPELAVAAPVVVWAALCGTDIGRPFESQNLGNSFMVGGSVHGVKRKNMRKRRGKRKNKKKKERRRRTRGRRVQEHDDASCDERFAKREWTTFIA